MSLARQQLLLGQHHMTTDDVQVTLRVPGNWANSGEFVDAIPDGYRLTPDTLILPDGREIAIHFRKADDQFVSIFATACRRQPTDEEKKAIEKYSVQVRLTGPGGSDENAAAMMRAGAAVIQAGGSGVFVDNSGVAFGGTQWCEMTEIGNSDALSFAFVGIIRGKTDAFTVGMHILGLPDLLMRPEDLGDDGSVIIEMIQYLCSREREVGDGHVIADVHGPRFRVAAIDDERMKPGSPMHNPWGRLRLTSLKEIAESN